MANVTDKLFSQFGGLLGGVSEPSVSGGAMDRFLNIGERLGAGVSSGIRQAFGQQSPQEQLKAATQKLQQQGVDLGTPEGLTALANELNSNPNLSGIAMSLRQAAAKQSLESRKTESEIYKNVAQGQKATREGRTPLPDRLVALGTKEKTVGLTPAETAEKAELERVVRIQAPKEINLGAAFQSAEAKEDAKAASEAYTKLGEANVAAAKTLRDMDVVENLINDAFTGGATNLKIQASKIASAAGIKIPPTASNSEILTALFGKLVIPLVKQFPGALAVKELEALQKTQPQLLNEPETIKRLIALAKQDLVAIRAVYGKAAQYKSKNNGSSKGFDFALETGNVYDMIAEANSLTPEKLAELSKTEEGKKRLQELKPFLPRR